MILEANTSGQLTVDTLGNVYTCDCPCNGGGGGGGTITLSCCPVPIPKVFCLKVSDPLNCLGCGADGYTTTISCVGTPDLTCDVFQWTSGMGGSNVNFCNATGIFLLQIFDNGSLGPPSCLCSGCQLSFSFAGTLIGTPATRVTVLPIITCLTLDCTSPLTISQTGFVLNVGGAEITCSNVTMSVSAGSC